MSNVFNKITSGIFNYPWLALGALPVIIFMFSLVGAYAYHNTISFLILITIAFGFGSVFCFVLFLMKAFDK